MPGKSCNFFSLHTFFTSFACILETIEKRNISTFWMNSNTFLACVILLKACMVVQNYPTYN
jgi:hypothetical protein